MAGQTSGRGFAGMSKEKRTEIARRGGRKSRGGGRKPKTSEENSA